MRVCIFIFFLQFWGSLTALLLCLRCGTDLGQLPCSFAPLKDTKRLLKTQKMPLFNNKMFLMVFIFTCFFLQFWGSFMAYLISLRGKKRGLISWFFWTPQSHWKAPKISQKYNFSIKKCYGFREGFRFFSTPQGAPPLPHTLIDQKNKKVLQYLSCVTLGSIFWCNIAELLSFEVDIKWPNWVWGFFFIFSTP